MVNAVVMVLVCLIVLGTYLAHVDISRGGFALLLGAGLVTAVIVRTVLRRPA